MSYLKITIDLKGKDSSVLSNAHRGANGLVSLALYAKGPYPPEEVQRTVADYDGYYEGAKTGNRVEILKRNNARRQVTEMFRKIVSFLQSVATEEDIPTLIQAGFDAHVPDYRRKQATTSAAS
jgi:hypothetical protein